MSYYMKSVKGNNQDKDASSLAKTMMQGDQPKHAMGKPSLAGTMMQGGGKAGDKGSCKFTLGKAMHQSSK